MDQKRKATRHRAENARRAKAHEAQRESAGGNRVPEPESSGSQPEIQPTRKPRSKWLDRFLDWGCLLIGVLLVGGAGYLIFRLVRNHQQRTSSISELYRRSRVLALASAQESVGEYKSSAQIQGKVLIINLNGPEEDKSDFDSDTEQLPAALKPGTAADVGTIVVLKFDSSSSRDYECVKYQGQSFGRAASVYSCQVKVISKGSGTVVGATRLSDGPTCKPSTLTSSIHQYLLALPRK